MIDKKHISKIYKQGWFFLITLFLVFFPNVSAKAAGQPTITLSPITKNATVGDNFQVDITINPNGTSLDTARVEVSFPADKLQITSFTLGALFPNSAPVNSLDNINGLLSQGGAIYNGQTSDSGIFGTINFKVLTIGQAIISTTNNCRLIKSGVDKTGLMVLSTSIITGQVATVSTQCNDGIDNDSDGKIDLADPGCLNAQDNDETDLVVQPTVYQCNDGIDNDSDGKIDLADPGCLNAQDNDETDTIILPPEPPEQPLSEELPPEPQEQPPQPEQVGSSSSDQEQNIRQGSSSQQVGQQIEQQSGGSGGVSSSAGSNVSQGEDQNFLAQEKQQIVQITQVAKNVQKIVANTIDILNNITAEEIGQQVEKAVQTTIKVAKVTQKATIDNPVVEKVNEDIKKPALVTTVATSAAAVATAGTTGSLGVSIFTYGQFLTNQFFAFFTRRKKKKWGVVYNSVTKQPVDLAVVRVYEVSTNRIIRTQVTDRHGRYHFILSPGLYRFVVTRAEFNFPCRLLNNSKVDGNFQDVYYGEEVEVKAKDVVDLPIPLDPERQSKDYKSLMRIYLLRRWQLFLTTLGVFVALLSYIINPQRWVGILVIAQILTYVILRKLVVGLKPKTWGVVRDIKNKANLSKAIVRVFDTTFNKLLDTQITDRRGRYAFLVGNQKYYMTGEKPGYHLEKTSVYDLADKKSGFLVEDLYLKPHGYLEQPPTNLPEIQSIKETIITPPPQLTPKIEIPEVAVPEVKQTNQSIENMTSQVDEKHVKDEEMERLLNIGGLEEPGEKKGNE